MPAADAMTAVTADGIDFVDENNAGSGFLALLKHVAHATRADTDKHFHEVRAADGKEGHIGFAGNGAGQQGFARAGRADHEHALGNAAPEFLELFRIAQKLDQFLHFILGFLDPGDVAKGDLVLVAREHAGFGFAEIESPFAGHADLLAEEEIKNEEKNGDREEPENGLADDIRIGPDGWLDAGGGQFLLQVTGEIQVNGRLKGDGLGLRALAQIKSAESLRGAAFLDHECERIILVVLDDLFAVEQLEKAIIGNVLDVGVGAAAKDHGQPD